MEVMKALFLIPFYLLLLTPLTLNSETGTQFSFIEKTKSPVVSWTQAAPLHSDAVELEQTTEESNGDFPYLATLLADLEPAQATYVNLFYISSTSLWNPVLQFCSLFTISPPQS